MRLIALLLGVVLVATWLVIAPSRALAACGNPVACENQLPGDPPSDWQVVKVGDSAIQGYATQFSVNAGQTESFKIKTPSTSYHIDILRLGYYGGAGARKVASGIRPSVSLPQSQPACLTDSSNGLIDCGNWGVSASWTVPSNAVSGVYIAHLVRDDASNPNGGSLIPFVVRNDSSHSDVVLSTSDATWQAYNAYGGNSLYTCTVSCPPGNPLAYKAAYAVSYNRPFDGAFTTDNGFSYLWYAEYQMIRFLEQNGYDISYVSDSDLDANPSLLPNHKLFISSGHDEYWSKNEYQGLTSALGAGVNLAFFSGNEMFWKTRWANSEDGSSTPYRTLITYKETHFNAPVDPQDPPTWTGAWADPRFSPPADGGIPANSLTGQEFLVNSGSADLTVPYQYSKLRLWRNTAVAKLTSGQTLTLAPNGQTLGYEWDVDADNGFRPPGLIDLSSTTVSNVQPFTDYGSTTGTGTETHHLILYRASSGALVFGAGTVQWSWGLDTTNAWNASGPPGSPDPNMQQATVNLFADMGVQPTTLMAGLAGASRSSDSTPPVSTITSPAAGANFNDGSPTTITGTATDGGGGIVAGVEVSTDGGSTWHPATITTTPDAQTINWTYNWIAQGNPATTILARATDDSGNIESPSAGVTVNVSCPCSLWGAGTPGGATDSADPSAVSVGMKFTSSQFGTINAIRFYKVSTNAGTHVGDLWSASGQLLASVTFTNETTSGWQQANLSSPVTILPNTTYVVSYFAPKGHYADTPNYFYPQPSPGPLGGGSYNNPPLHAVQNMTSGDGVYAYGSSAAFPTNSDVDADNYWVDVQFTASPPPGQVTGVSATAANASAYLTWNAPTTGGTPNSYVITPYVNGVAQPPTTVTGLPPATNATVTGLTNGTAYTFTVTATNPNGAGPASAPTNAVTPSSSIFIPAFAQQATAHGNASSLAVTPTSNLTSGNRLLVVAGVWSSSAATAGSVTDSVGDTFVELEHYKAPDGTEMSLWTAPVTVGGGKRPTITLKPTGSADVGMAVSEYSGLSTASGSGVVDQTAQAAGTTGGAATVASGATPSTTAPYELAIGMYVDSGFGDSLTTGSGFTQRSNVSGTSDMELLTEDQILLSSGATPNATVGTGANTPWDMATVVLKSATGAAPTAPGAPTGVGATAGNGSATVSWTAPSNGGSQITSYTVTPYIGSTAQAPTTVTGSPPATSTTITGLTNGTTYTFTVTATNAIGTGPASNPSNAVTPAAPTVPGAPTSVTATPGTGSATVSWTAPSNGGSQITNYTVTPYIGGTAQTPTTVTGSPPATSTTITGLTNGATYTFTVTATNAIGTGLPSSPSNAVTPASLPGPPTTVAATAGNAQATVTWAAPSDGGSPITSYTITPYVGTTAQTPTVITGSPPATTATITGLTNGTTYTFTVAATNAVGTGPASSASNTATPASVPGAPTGVGATAGNGSATVSWTAPSNGGSQITNYTVTPYIGGTAQPPTTVTGSPPATSTTITGLTNGTTYTFTVTATNAIGTGPASNPSNAVTPAAPTVPGAPTSVTATPGTGSATVSWTAPSNGGSQITNYTVTPYIGGTAQPPTTVTGSPPATSTTITGLTNGTTYTFTVTATNAIGTGLPSSPSNPVTPGVANPTVVQQVSTHTTNVTSASMVPTSNITVGNRLVVLVGVWSNGAATAKSVTDSAGNSYVEVQHFKASDNTELSVWTAQVTAGGGTKPTIVVTPSARADVGAAALEYSGLSTAVGSAAIDQTAQNSGTTTSAATVGSGATAATTSANELAIGFYIDSGFNDALTAGSGFASRVNVSRATNIELLVEDQVPGLGATPSATAGTGSNTTWLMSTIVFKHA